MDIISNNSSIIVKFPDYEYVSTLGLITFGKLNNRKYHLKIKVITESLIFYCGKNYSLKGVASIVNQILTDYAYTTFSGKIQTNCLYKEVGKILIKFLTGTDNKLYLLIYEEYKKIPRKF